MGMGEAVGEFESGDKAGLLVQATEVIGQVVYGILFLKVLPVVVRTAINMSLEYNLLQCAQIALLHVIQIMRQLMKHCTINTYPIATSSCFLYNDCRNLGGVFFESRICTLLYNRAKRSQANEDDGRTQY